jgi:O-antigen/teichoic acid export membrane protein
VPCDLCAQPCPRPDLNTPIKKFLSNIGLVVLLNLLIKPIWVLTEMEVQDVVGHDDWGMYAAALSFGFLFLTLADLGINYYATKALASAPDQLRDMFPQLISVKLILLIAYPLLMYGAAMALGYEPRQLSLLFWLCLVQAGAQFMEFFRANFRAMQRFGLDAWLSVFDRVLLLALVAGLFATTLTIETFVYARLAAVGLSVLVFYGLLTRLYGWLRPRFRWGMVRELVRFSLPFAAITMLSSIHDKVDQVMLERMAGDLPTGLYAAAYRWLEAFSMYLWTILPLFFARFAYLVQRPADQQRLFHLGQLITGLPLTFLCVFGFFFGDKLLFLYDHSTATELATILTCLQILLVALLINGNLAVFSTLLAATGHERFINRLLVLSISINVLLNLWLIPSYGAVACAWSTVASFLAMGLGYVWYVQRRTAVAVPWRAMGLQILAGGLLGGCFAGLDALGLPWWATTLVAGTCYALLIVGLRLIRLSDLKAGLNAPANDFPANDG